jgi:hypothetical protein
VTESRARLRSVISWTIASLLLLALTAAPGVAQLLYGGVVGVVKDSQGSLRIFSLYNAFTEQQVRLGVRFSF